MAKTNKKKDLSVQKICTLYDMRTGCLISVEKF